jgi:hypothetical protein
MKIQSTKELFAEMRAVARGELPAPPEAAVQSWESFEAAAADDWANALRLCRVPHF